MGFSSNVALTQRNRHEQAIDGSHRSIGSCPPSKAAPGFITSMAFGTWYRCEHRRIGFQGLLGSHVLMKCTPKQGLLGFQAGGGLDVSNPSVGFAKSVAHILLISVCAETRVHLGMSVLGFTLPWPRLTVRTVPL